ncbi:MAG: hypothetical protein K0R20_1981, partial [Actinomycetia bacterium]|nr:hypothetical protein [Actinomycetes bacterium]
VGRTARAGRTGTGITFVTPEKTTDVGKIAGILKLHTEFGDAGLRIESLRRHQSSRPSSGRRPRPARRGR